MTVRISQPCYGRTVLYTFSVEREQLIHCVTDETGSLTSAVRPFWMLAAFGDAERSRCRRPVLTTNSQGRPRRICIGSLRC